jgi:hypothetical protein
MKEYTYSTMLRLCDYKSTDDVKDPVKNEEGEYEFWTHRNGVESLSPVWGASLGVNLTAPDSWVGGYIEECMAPCNMPQESAEYLKTVSAQEFLDSMAFGVFDTLSRIWSQKNKGVREKMQTRHQYTTRLNNRRVAVSTTTSDHARTDYSL